MRIKPSLRTTAVIVCFACLALALAAPAALHARDSSDRDFVDSIAEFVFALAWPTATYESVGFGESRLIPGGAEIAFRLHGTSAWGGGPLWVDVVLEVRNGEVTDLRWGQHNAILAAPGETVKALGQALAQLSEEYSQGGGASSGGATTGTTSGQGYVFRFTNACRRPLKLAIHYLTPAGSWTSAGWWSFVPGETAVLNSSGGQALLSNNSTWYYFAETTDGSRLEWAGDVAATLDGRELRMRKATDESGDSEWRVTCD